MDPQKANPTGGRELTPPYARCLIPLIRPFPNFSLFFVKSLRQRAAQRLQLQPGDRVLDVGCGPGGSFPYLVDAVTQSGVVVGVEISPEVAMHAKKRAEKNGWTNVEVIVADAKKVELQGTFDALTLYKDEMPTSCSCGVVSGWGDQLSRTWGITCNCELAHSHPAAPAIQ